MNVAKIDLSHTQMSNNISKVDAAEALIMNVMMAMTFMPANFATKDLNGRVNYSNIKRANTIRRPYTNTFKTQYVKK